VHVFNALCARIQIYTFTSYCLKLVLDL